jgi:transcriptional regulator with XRE-family HTH domain
MEQEFRFNGKIIAHFRKIEKTTQSQLARELEVNTSTISRVERGVHQPSIDLMMRLMQYFALDLAQVVHEVQS